jgi:hypothetical protein
VLKWLFGANRSGASTPSAVPLPFREQYTVFADYFQFYVCDEAIETDTAAIWNEVTVSAMLATGPDLVAIGTARNIEVPVTLEVFEGEPALDLAEWDQVIDCDLAVTSGKLLLLGCTQSPDDAPKLPIAAGHYRARVAYANLASVSDDYLEGDDRYRVQLWKGHPTGVRVRKRRQEGVCPR